MTSALGEMRALCHRSTVQRRYYSGACSLAFLVSCALSVLVALLPLLLAHGSRDFSTQINSYREQPEVAFTYQCICVLEGKRTDETGFRSVPFSLVHTTLSPRINHILQAKSRSTHVKHYVRDIDGDGAVDALHVDIAVPLLANESVHRVTVAVILNYTLSSYAKISMDALVLFTHESAMPGSLLLVDGDLSLYQRKPFAILEVMQTPYDASPIVNLSLIQSPQDLQFQSMVSRYRDRDYSAIFEPRYPVWKTDVSVNPQPHTQRRFQVSAAIRVPAVDVLYHPTWAEVLKKAWIQYYCILVVISTLAMHLREYLFKSNLLSSVSTVDDPHLRRALAAHKSR